VNGYRWHAAAAELAEVVRTVGPNIALTGAVIVALVAAALILRYWVFLPRFGI
jgi:hypothetical protein